VAVVVAGVGGVAPAAPAPPTVTLSTTSLVPGQTIMIGGTGWPRGTAFQAVLCGSDATAGSVDCSDQSAATFVPFTDGTLHGQLLVVTPPAPCPCVVQVAATNTPYTTTIPVTVAGATVAPVAPEPVADVGAGLTAKTSIASSSSLGAFFGGSAGRVLTVTLHNAGTHPVTTLVTAQWGSSDHPDDVITSPPTVTVDPGKTRTVTMPFTLAPLSHGTYHVVGQASGTAPQLTFATTTSTFPWGILLVILAVVGLLVYRSYRRRQAAEQEQRRLEEVGAVEGATGLGALAAMSWAVAAPLGEDDTLRITGAWLTGDLNGELQTVPVSVLTMDSRGIGVTNPDTQLRVLAWSTIRRVHVVADFPEMRVAAGTAPPPAKGAVIEVDTVRTTYHFVCPRNNPADLSPRVDEVSRRWVTPPRKVPALAL
jgi:hypothetical protein